MPDQEEQAVRSIGNALAEFNRKLRLARATDMARSGRFLEAEALLRPFGEQPKDALELDLLARIAVQRWRFEEARSLWEAAIRSDPANEQYRKCIFKLDVRKARLEAWARIAGISLTAVIFGAILTAFVLKHRDRYSASPAPITTPAPTATPALTATPASMTTPAGALLPQERRLSQ